MALKVQFKEIRRTFLCFNDGSVIPKAVTDVPTIEKLEVFSLNGFLSLELSSKAISSILYGSFFDDQKERYFEGVISYLAHQHAKDVVASEVDMVALKIEFKVMTDIFEPSERCMVCPMVFQLREAVECNPYGHTYHEDCTEYYISDKMDCLACYYDERTLELAGKYINLSIAWHWSLI